MGFVKCVNVFEGMFFYMYMNGNLNVNDVVGMLGW